MKIVQIAIIVIAANDVKNVMNVTYALIWLNLIIAHTVKMVDGCNIAQNATIVINA